MLYLIDDNALGAAEDMSRRKCSLTPGKASQFVIFHLLHLKRYFRFRLWDQTFNRLFIHAVLQHAVPCFFLMTVGEHCQ